MAPRPAGPTSVERDTVISSEDVPVVFKKELVDPVTLAVRGADYKEKSYVPPR